MSVTAVGVLLTLFDESQSTTVKNVAMGFTAAVFVVLYRSVYAEETCVSLSLNPGPVSSDLSKRCWRRSITVVFLL